MADKGAGAAVADGHDDEWLPCSWRKKSMTWGVAILVWRWSRKYRWTRSRRGDTHRAAMMESFW